MTANKKQVASSSTKTKKKKKLRQCMEENKEHLSTFAHVKAGSQSEPLTPLDRDEAGPVGWRRRRRQMSGVCCSSSRRRRRRSRRKKAFLPQSLSISLSLPSILCKTNSPSLVQDEKCCLGCWSCCSLTGRGQSMRVLPLLLPAKRRLWLVSGQQPFSL